MIKVWDFQAIYPKASEKQLFKINLILIFNCIYSSIFKPIFILFWIEMKFDFHINESLLRTRFDFDINKFFIFILILKR